MPWVGLTTLLPLLLMLQGLSALPKPKLPDTDPGIYLSINPLASTQPDGQIVKRRLEITWYGKKVEPEDLIELKKGSELVLQFSPVKYPDGYHTTEKQLPYPHINDLMVPSCMFNYSASWIGGTGSTLATACLRNEPMWQWEHKEALSKMKIGSMMLAGTHDAGAYRDYQGEGDDNLATRAVFAQEEDLLNQLLWGVRFLDIRVGYYPTLEDKFWLVHGIIKTWPMAVGISQVKQFLRSSRDVIVFEINGFEQPWNDEAHKEWKELLLNEFGRWLVAPGSQGWSTTVQDIWNREGLPSEEGRMIITYNNNIHTDPTVFFPQVLGRWGDVNEPAALREYLETEVSQAYVNPGYKPWKPNCQLTPTEIDIILGKWKGLRDMANAVNRNVTAWWRDEWTDLDSTFPIHDFILGTDMIAESIRRNLRLAHRMSIP